MTVYTLRWPSWLLDFWWPEREREREREREERENFQFGAFQSFPPPHGSQSSFSWVWSGPVSHYNARTRQPEKNVPPLVRSRKKKEIHFVYSSNFLSTSLTNSLTHIFSHLLTYSLPLSSTFIKHLSPSVLYTYTHTHIQTHSQVFEKLFSLSPFPSSFLRAREVELKRPE